MWAAAPGYLTAKEYFTIYDLVNAHEHFNDPEWDSEPIEPEPRGSIPDPGICPDCGVIPCVCVREPEICSDCGEYPGICDTSPRRMIRVKLSDHKVRELDYTVKTSFWSPDGTPISAEEFIANLLGKLPDLIKNEDKLPRTDRAERAKLHLDSLDPKQQEFINFVLEQYIKDGVTG